MSRTRPGQRGDGWTVTFIARLGTNTDGATAVEYGLAAALIAVAAITALQNVGNSVENSLNEVDGEMSVATVQRFEAD
jgi:pilus assembly protein Flp/PilA